MCLLNVQADSSPIMWRPALSAKNRDFGRCAINPHTMNPPKPSPRRRRPRYHVYVVELSADVLQEARFRRCNPDYIEGKPCVYVGMTGLDPDLRFDKHMAGIQSNAYVFRYGIRLLPDLYEGFNPMTRDDAAEREIEIGIDLRSAGFGVWQA